MYLYKRFRIMDKENTIKRFWKDKVTKWFTVSLWIAIFIISIVIVLQYNDLVFWMWIFIIAIVTLIWLYKISEVYYQSLIIEEDCLRIRWGILFVEDEEIRYNKINTIKVNTILWMWNLEIMTGNDKKIVFTHLDNYELAKKLINEKLDWKKHTEKESEKKQEETVTY